MALRVFKGTLAHSLGLKQLEIIERGSIGVNEAGTIEFVARSSGELDKFLTSFPNAQIIDCGSKFIMPGFVDTHCHAPQYSYCGLGTGVPLLEWLEKFTFNFESHFKEVAYAEKVYPKVVSKLLQNGTTTVSYFATIHLDATKVLHQICVSAGQRALIGKVCMDRNSPSHYIEESTQASLDTTKTFIEYCNNQKSSLVQPTITPRFAITCTSELLNGLGAMAKKYDVHIQSHLSENKGEIAFVKELFPDKTYTEVYKDAGLLTPKTVMAHCVHLQDDELELLKGCGAGISHCPTSNLSMFSGLLHVRRALDAGVSVGLGTDVAGGFSSSILATIRDALAVASAVQAKASNEAEQRAGITFDEGFYLATLGGAKALALDSVIGNFCPGKAFDALIVNVGANGSMIDVFGHETPTNLFEKFIYQGDDRNIEHVFVQGRRVHGSSSSAEF